MDELGAVENVPVREDGLVARAELLAFSVRCHAALSDWELDKMFARLDGEMRGAIPKRSIRTALMCCDVLEAPAQASIRRAVECLSRIHQDILRFRPATTEAALRSVFLEVAASKQPLRVQREELAAAAGRLGVEQVWLDELWFAAPKLRDNSLDIDSFCKQVELSPMPGEKDDDTMSVLWNMIDSLFAAREAMFPGVGRAEHVSRTGAMIQQVLMTASGSRIVPRQLPDAESVACTLKDSFDHIEISSDGEPTDPPIETVTDSAKRSASGMFTRFVDFHPSIPKPDDHASMPPLCTEPASDQDWARFDEIEARPDHKSFHSPTEINSWQTKGCIPGFQLTPRNVQTEPSLTAAWTEAPQEPAPAPLQNSKSHLSDTTAGLHVPRPSTQAEANMPIATIIGKDDNQGDPSPSEVTVDRALKETHPQVENHRKCAMEDMNIPPSNQTSGSACFDTLVVATANQNPQNVLNEEPISIRLVYENGELPIELQVKPTTTALDVLKAERALRGSDDALTIHDNVGMPEVGTAIRATSASETAQVMPLARNFINGLLRPIGDQFKKLLTSHRKGRENPQRINKNREERDFKQPRTRTSEPEKIENQPGPGTLEPEKIHKQPASRAQGPDKNETKEPLELHPPTFFQAKPHVAPDHSGPAPHLQDVSLPPQAIRLNVSNSTVTNCAFPKQADVHQTVSPAPITSSAIATSFHSFPHMMSRLEFLRYQSTWVSKDEMDFYLQCLAQITLGVSLPTIHCPGDMHDIATLAPLADWMLCFQQWAERQRSPVFSACLHANHWIPFLAIPEKTIQTTLEGFSFLRSIRQELRPIIPFMTTFWTEMLSMHESASKDLLSAFDGDCGFQTVSWIQAQLGIDLILTPS
eukprot:s2225_g4.t1